MLSLSKHERGGFSISPFDKLRANGHFSLYAYQCLLMADSDEFRPDMDETGISFEKLAE
jgi:hypothetical protein